MAIGSIVVDPMSERPWLALALCPRSHCCPCQLSALQYLNYILITRLIAVNDLSGLELEHDMATSALSLCLLSALVLAVSAQGPRPLD